MRIDLYTKTILTLIALLLAVIALKPMIHPTVTAQAQSPSANVEFMGGFGLITMDKITGKVWIYDATAPAANTAKYLGQFVGLGKDLVKEGRIGNPTTTTHSTGHMELPGASALRSLPAPAPVPRPGRPRA